MENPGTPLHVPFGAIGGPRSLSPYTKAPLRLAPSAALAISRGHGRFAEAILGGNCFYATSNAGIDLGNALKTAANTLTLYNPINSGVLLSLLHVGVAFTSVPSGAINRHGVLVLAGNIDPLAAALASTTDATFWGNAFLGAQPQRGVGKAFRLATLPAIPITLRHLGLWVTTDGSQASSMGHDIVNDKTDGLVMLGPNTAVTVQAILAGGTWAGTVTMLWEEIPIGA